MRAWHEPRIPFQGDCFPSNEIVAIQFSHWFDRVERDTFLEFGRIDSKNCHWETAWATRSEIKKFFNNFSRCDASRIVCSLSNYASSYVYWKRENIQNTYNIRNCTRSEIEKFFNNFSQSDASRIVCSLSNYASSCVYRGCKDIQNTYNIRNCREHAK